MAGAPLPTPLRRTLTLLLALTGLAGAQVARWDCAAPGALGAWLGSDGAVQVGWVALAAEPGAAQATLDRRARASIERAYRCVPELQDAEVSVYPIGTPGRMSALFAAEPLMTLSVPRARRSGWAHLPVGHWAGYDRVWYAGKLPPEPPPIPQVTHAAWPLWAQLTGLTLGGVRGEVLRRGAPWAGAVALTVDDGPHPIYTPLLLAALRREGLGASFFFIGRGARAYPYLVRDAVRQGVEIENHSYLHLRPEGLSAAEQWAELMRAQQLLTRLSGRAPRYFRPPGGRLTPTLLAQARQAGITLALWTDDPADYATRGPGQLRNRLERHLTRGAVLLLHDNAEGTLGALGPLARELRTRGLRAVPLSELLR